MVLGDMSKLAGHDGQSSTTNCRLSEAAVSMRGYGETREIPSRVSHESQLAFTNVITDSSSSRSSHIIAAIENEQSIYCNSATH